MTTPDRKKLLARFHLTAEQSDITGERYKQWLKERTGQESCSDLTDDQIKALLPEFEATRNQWRKVGAQCRELGWTGFQDPNFRAFVMRVTKKEEPRFLTKKQLRNVIAGLSNWIKQKRKKGELPNKEAKP